MKCFKIINKMHLLKSSLRDTGSETSPNNTVYCPCSSLSTIAK